MTVETIMEKKGHWKRQKEVQDSPPRCGLLFWCDLGSKQSLPENRCSAGTGKSQFDPGGHLLCIQHTVKTNKQKASGESSLCDCSLQVTWNSLPQPRRRRRRWRRMLWEAWAGSIQPWTGWASPREEGGGVMSVSSEAAATNRKALCRNSLTLNSAQMEIHQASNFFFFKKSPITSRFTSFSTKSMVKLPEFLSVSSIELFLTSLFDCIDLLQKPGVNNEQKLHDNTPGESTRDTEQPRYGFVWAALKSACKGGWRQRSRWEPWSSSPGANPLNILTLALFIMKPLSKADWIRSLKSQEGSEMLVFLGCF